MMKSRDCNYVAANQVMMATVRRSKRSLQLNLQELLVQQLPCQLQPSIKEIVSSGIQHQLTDIYSIYMCCWNVAPYIPFYLHVCTVFFLAGSSLYSNISSDLCILRSSGNGDHVMSEKMIKGRKMFLKRTNSQQFFNLRSASYINVREYEWGN